MDPTMTATDCGGSCVFGREYQAAQRHLDQALGDDWYDGTGGGLVADVALLVQRYLDLRAAVTQMGARGVEITAEVDARELR